MKRQFRLLSAIICFSAALCLSPRLPAFELGLYNGGNGENAEVRSRGADFIMSYTTVNTTVLNNCASAGLRALVEIPRPEVQQVDPSNPNCPHLAAIQTFITGLRPNGSDHPAVMGWYLYDEPETDGVTPAQTAAVHSLIKAYSSLPVYMVFCTDIAPDFKDSYDVLMYDYYHFRSGIAEYVNMSLWRQRNAEYAALANQLGREFCPVLQGYGNWSGSSTMRLPTLGEARAQAHMALQSGADRMMWFMYQWAKTSTSQPDQPYPYDGLTWLGISPNYTNAVFYKLQAELHRFSDGVDNDEISGGIESVSDANIKARVFYSPAKNKTYVAAVNMSGKTVSSVTISLNLSKTYNTAARIGAGESGSVAVSGGVFTDNFTKYQAHTYELDTAGRPGLPSGSPALACVLNLDLTRDDGVCGFSVGNDSASAAGIERVVLTGASDDLTFEDFNSNGDFSVTPSIRRSANLLNNSGFESNSSNWSLGSGNYSVQSTVKHSGSKALKYTRASASEYVLAVQTLQSVTPGAHYSASCFIKTENVTNGNGGGATLCVQWYTADGGWIGGAYPAGLTGTNDWTLVSDSMICPANAGIAKIGLYLRQNATGTAYFDDVEFTRSETNFTANNLGFEEGSSGWWMENSNYTVQSTVKHSGSKALKYTRSSASEYVTAGYSIWSVCPGAHYSASCFIKTENVTAGNGNGGASLCLQWYNANGSWISGSYPAGLTGTNDWALVSTGDMVCPANASFASVVLYLARNSTGTAYFDDVQINGTLTNLGFESGLSGWWTSGGNYTVQSTVKRGGASALKYTRSSSSEYVSAGQSLQSVCPGAHYSAGCFIKTEGVTPNGTNGGASLCLQWYNASGGWISGSYPKGVNGTNDWTFVSTGDVVCPTNASFASVVLYLLQGATGTAYFDDVCVISHNDAPELLFSSPLAAGAVSSTASNKIIPENGGGMTATVFFANGFRLQGLFRDKGGPDGLSHYIAELSNIKSARVEIDPSSGNNFDCRIANLSKAVRIKRVKIEASNKPFDSFSGTGDFTVITNAGVGGDGVSGNYAILDLAGDGLGPGLSTANDQAGTNILSASPADLKATVYFSDGSSVSGAMQNIGDSDDGDSRGYVFQK